VGGLGAAGLPRGRAKKGWPARRGVAPLAGRRPSVARAAPRSAPPGSARRSHARQSGRPRRSARIPTC